MFLIFALLFALSPASTVVEQINVLRVEHQLAPLVINSSLEASAQRYALTMANGSFFSHTSPEGSTLLIRAEAAGYTHWTYLGESLAGGQGTATEVVIAWMASPAHREILLSSRPDSIGIGYVFVPESPYLSYWVLETGAQEVAQPVATPLYPD